MAHPTDNKLGELCFFLLRKSGVCVSKREFLKHLYTNENYASLLAVTETLSYWGIETVCARTDIGFLQENKEPALLYLRSAESSEFVVLIDFPASDQIRYKDENLHTHIQPLAEFLAHWDGVALFVLSPDLPMPPDRSVWAWRCLAGCLLLMSGWIAYQAFEASSLYFIFLCLKIAGLSVTVLLLRHTLGMTSKMEHTICTFHRQVDCDAVLSSPAARIGKLASMSDIGFVYFAGGIIVLLAGLLTSDEKAYLDTLCILSYLSFAYTLFSLFYQRIIVKKWCPLCLGVLLIIWIECGVGYAHAGVHLPPATNVAVVLFVFMSVAWVWKAVSFLLKENLRLENIEYAYLKIKKDSTVFHSLVGPPVVAAETAPSFSYPLICGNKNAPCLLTVVLSFSCYPCRNLFFKIKSHLGREDNKIKCRFVFLLKSEKDGLQAELLTAIYRKEGEEAFLKALSGSFDKIEAFEEETEETKEHCQLADEHRSWVEKRKITYTPALLCDDKNIPLWYDWEEVVYFLN